MLKIIQLVRTLKRTVAYLLLFLLRLFFISSPSIQQFVFKFFCHDNPFDSKDGSQNNYYWFSTIYAEPYEDSTRPGIKPR